MATGAERQAAWRQRRDARLAELEKLCAEQQAEIQALRNNAPAAPSRNELEARWSGDRVHDMLAQVEGLLKQVPLGNPARKLAGDALEYVKAAERNVRHSLVQLDKKVAKINEVRLQSKIEGLAERGATEGERAASTAALKRLASATTKAEEAACTLPRTREEMLARRSRKSRVT